MGDLRTCMYVDVCMYVCMYVHVCTEGMSCVKSKGTKYTVATRRTTKYTLVYMKLEVLHRITEDTQLSQNCITVF